MRNCRLRYFRSTAGLNYGSRRALIRGGGPAVPSGETINFTGAAVTRTITSATAGKLVIKAWGAAGASAFASPTPCAAADGGGGGFQTASFNVVAGDVVEIRVGGGGAICNSATHVAGAGGYPDGGPGGSSTTSPTAIGTGGGGGTRVYINGVLVLVAGAGGGGGACAGGSFGTGAAAGGGNTGQDSSTGTHGGSQVAGGLNDNTATQSGASLQGGTGYNVPGSTAQAVTPAGGGGGGGYFGGAGGGNQGINNLGSTLAGAAGSSYANTAIGSYVAASASTTAGAGRAVGNSGDAKYPGVTIGVGPLAVNGATGGTVGGNGAVWLGYAQ